MINTWTQGMADKEAKNIHWSGLTEYQIFFQTYLAGCPVQLVGLTCEMNNSTDTAPLKVAVIIAVM